MTIDDVVNKELVSVGEESIDKTVNDTYLGKEISFWEGFVAGGVTIFSGYTLLLNFGYWTDWDRLSKKCDKVLTEAFSSENRNSGCHASLPPALFTYLLCEALLYKAIGGWWYLGAKAITNTAGYFYYKRKREAHHQYSQLEEKK